MTGTRRCGGSRWSALKNGSPRPDTIQLLTSVGDDDEQPRELREAAAKVAQLLAARGK